MKELNKAGMRYALLKHGMLDFVKIAQSQGLHFDRIVLKQNSGELYVWESPSTIKSQK